MDYAKKEKLTPGQALQKLKQYCAYQERCHNEVKDKLYSYGLHSTDVDVCVSQLIEEDYLNEERFAMAYVGGKFRTKNWGRTKIIYNLKLKQISAYCIKKAIAQINEDEYMAVLQKELEQKLKTLKNEKNIFIKKTKLRNFLQQHGFETNLINEVLKNI